jgi:PPOX class probable F420-dependent enzyme
MLSAVLPDEVRRRFGRARVGRLATADRSGRPHVVPFVFALDGDRLWWAVDHKPKRTTALRRLANIAENPRVAALVDGYDEDWSALWWARADGIARLVSEEASRAEGLRTLAAKYQQYRTRPPGGPVVAIDVERWSGWSASDG